MINVDTALYRVWNLTYKAVADHVERPVRDNVIVFTMPQSIDALVDTLWIHLMEQIDE